MNTHWFSLRRHLLLWLLGGVTVGWLGAMGYAYVEARDEILELLEERHDADEEHVRHELAEHFVKTMFTPLLFGLPLLGGWVWFATRRVTESIEQERRFTADAAHELRTPLAAILAQTQVAGRARDVQERDQALAQIAASSRRAARLVDQLLLLARLDPAAGIARESLRLDVLATEVCAAHGAAALDKDIALELDAPREVVVAGNADLLRVLLRNLLDNALRYTPAGGRVAVHVSAAGLAVSDSGPGIPAAERENALRRFHRLAGQETAGSGLGLSIVARIAELHGAKLRLGDRPGGGLRVEVAFSS